jgi:hypothetical protein
MRPSNALNKGSASLVVIIIASTASGSIDHMPEGTWPAGGFSWWPGTECGTGCAVYCIWSKH